MAQERWQFPCLTPIVVQDALRGLAGLSRIACMDAKPVNLTEALASFDEVYSPRIVARMNDYDVRIAHAKGEHVWHVHDDTDEFFLVLDGRFDIAVRDPEDGETTVVLRTGDT